MLAGNVADQEQAESSAFDPGESRPAGDAVEAVEDALELIGRKADAGVGDREVDRGVTADRQRAANTRS